MADRARYAANSDRRTEHLHMHKVSRETYNRRGMSNMQLNDGPHSAWAGACRTSSDLGSY